MIVTNALTTAPCQHRVVHAINTFLFLLLKLSLHCLFHWIWLTGD